METNFICKYCGKVCKNKLSLSKHEQYCLANPNALSRSLFTNNAIKSNKNRKITKALVNEYTCICKKCGKEYTVKCTEKQYKTGKFSHFCSRSCANSRIHSNLTKYKISQTLLNNYDIKDSMTYDLNYVLSTNINYKQVIQFCQLCNKPYIGNGKYCETCRKLRLSEGGKHSAAVQSNIRRSKNEILFYDYCKNYFNTVTHNESIFNGWDADILIHDIKIAILWNGPWHYKKITQAHSVKQVQNRDNIKLNEIRNAGWTPYIIKDMGKFNSDFVEKQFNIFLDFLSNQ